MNNKQTTYTLDSPFLQDIERNRQLALDAYRRSQIEGFEATRFARALSSDEVSGERQDEHVVLARRMASYNNYLNIRIWRRVLDHSQAWGFLSGWHLAEFEVERFEKLPHPTPESISQVWPELHALVYRFIGDMVLELFVRLEPDYFDTDKEHFEQSYTFEHESKRLCAGSTFALILRELSHVIWFFEGLDVPKFVGQSSALYVQYDKLARGQEFVSDSVSIQLGEHSSVLRFGEGLLEWFNHIMSDYVS